MSNEYHASVIVIITPQTAMLSKNEENVHTGNMTYTAYIHRTTQNQDIETTCMKKNIIKTHIRHTETRKKHDCFRYRWENNLLQKCVSTFSIQTRNECQSRQEAKTVAPLVSV